MTANQVVAATNIGVLAYTPPENANGTGYASFTFKVSDGTAESAVAYTMTITVTAVNDAPTVANTMTDQPATVGTAFSYAFPANTFSDADTGATLSYTATKADGATLPTWLGFAAGTRTFSGTPQTADVGTVSVKVTASDGNGGSVSDDFDITVSAAANTLATGAPTITGTAQVGQTLTAVTTAIMDDDGLTSVSYAYQWIRVDGGAETNISGATASTHTLVAADQGTTIKVKVSFTDDASNPETLTSTATVAVAAAPNTPATGAPAITGTAQVGQTLTAGTTAIVDADGLNSVSYMYQWIRVDGTDADISGATASTYTLVTADQGKTIKVKVSFTDDASNAETLTSAATATVSAAANTLATGAPTITGTAQVGQTLTAGTTGIMDANGLTNVSYTYQWIRVATDNTETNISGATASTHTLVAADQGTTIKVTVSFTDDASNAETLTSAATATVTLSDGDGGGGGGGSTVRAVDDAAETPEGTPVTIAVLDNDSHSDGNQLTVVEVSAPAHGTAVLAAAGTVEYTPERGFHGTDRFTYVVGDGSGLTAQAAVEVTVLPVNDPPLAGDDAAETPEDTPVTIAVLANDSDPDGDTLTVVEVSAPAHGTAVVAAAGTVEYTPEPDFHGTDRFTYVVGDGSRLTARAAVEVTVLPVNDPPLATGVIPDQTLDVGDGPAVLDLIPFFEDRDGDALGYTAVVSDQAVAVSLTGATLTLTATRLGTATVTVTAQDPGGLTATQAFMVTTTDHQARGVVEDTLAALGRGHLASARATLGRRVETTGQEQSQVTVAGLHVPLGTGAAAAGRAVAERWITGLAGGMPLQSGGRSGPDAGAVPGAFGVAGAPGAMGSPAGALGLAAGGAPFGSAGAAQFGGGASPTLSSVSPLGGGGQTEFLLALGRGQAGGGAAQGHRWTVWGQHDQQAFGGERSPAARYDGRLRTAYVGVDARLSDRWLAGVAVSRSRGDGDWTFGSSTGRLTTTLTSVQPYLRWSDGGTTIWATAGGGTGTVENERVRYGLQEESDLGLQLGLVEVRRRLATVGGGVELQLRGDASWARLTTAAGNELIDALEVQVRQLRIGIDVSRPVRTAGGTLVEPFGEVHARRDRGVGQTGAGLEVAGGLRVARGVFRVEGMGRLLALHAADGYREHGGAVTLSVGDGARQPGLTLSLAPRWGARATASDALWQEEVYGQATGGTGADERALDARVDYGLQLPAGGLVTPFGIYGQSPYGRRLQVGLLLSRLGPVGLEVSGERSAQLHPGRDQYRISVRGSITFGGADNASASPDAVP